MVNRILDSGNPLWVWVISAVTFIVGYVLTNGELRDAALLAIWIAVLGGFHMSCATFARGVVHELRLQSPSTVRLDRESIRAIRDEVTEALNQRNNNREN